MEIELSDQYKELLQAILLLILPVITLIIGMIFRFENVWYYILSITWFGSGMIFFSALN